MKTTILLLACLGRTWAQLGPPPSVYAPPLPKGAVAEKASADSPAVYAVAVDVSAPESLQDSLKSALLLELRKRPDVIITDAASHDDKWNVVCLISADVMMCSSLGLGNLKLVEVEKYYPDLANYGMWWAKRYLAEKSGSLLYHGVIAGSVSDIPRFAMRAVAAFEADTIEPARKFRADFLRKK